MLEYYCVGEQGVRNGALKTTESTFCLKNKLALVFFLSTGDIDKRHITKLHNSHFKKDYLSHTQVI